MFKNKATLLALSLVALSPVAIAKSGGTTFGITIAKPKDYLAVKKPTVCRSIGAGGWVSGKINQMSWTPQDIHGKPIGPAVMLNTHVSIPLFSKKITGLSWTEESVLLENGLSLFDAGLRDHFTIFEISTNDDFYPEVVPANQKKEVKKLYILQYKKGTQTTQLVMYVTRLDQNRMKIKGMALSLPAGGCFISED